MFIGSLQNIMGIMAMPPRFIPARVELINYQILLTHNPVLMWIWNSLFVLLMAVGLSIVITSMAGYALSVYDFPGKRLLFWAFIASLMIPRQVMIIPLFVLTRALGVAGTRWGAILPLLYWPFGILIFKTFCDSINKAMIDSGRIDGAGELRIIFSIVMPICKPIIGALILFQSIYALGDYVWQMLMLQKPEMQTLLIGLITAVMRRGGDSEMNVNPIGMQLAAGVILFLPLLVIFCFTSRYFVRDIKIGGIKE
jgi:multiple sugar transport system permease protein